MTRTRAFVLGLVITLAAVAVNIPFARSAKAMPAPKAVTMAQPSCCGDPPPLCPGPGCPGR